MKSHSKDIYNISKDLYFKQMQIFELSILNNSEKCIMISSKISSSTTVFNIDNNKKCFFSPNQHIRMISEGSCDTGIKILAENSNLHHRNKLHLEIY